MNAYQRHSAEVLSYPLPTASGAEALADARRALIDLSAGLHEIIRATEGRPPTAEEFGRIDHVVEWYALAVGPIFNRITEVDGAIAYAVMSIDVVRMCAVRAAGARTVMGSRDEWADKLDDALRALEMATARAIAYWDRQGLIGDGLLR